MYIPDVKELETQADRDFIANQFLNLVIRDDQGTPRPKEAVLSYLNNPFHARIIINDFHPPTAEIHALLRPPSTPPTKRTTHPNQIIAYGEQITSVQSHHPDGSQTIKHLKQNSTTGIGSDLWPNWLPTYRIRHTHETARIVPPPPWWQTSSQSSESSLLSSIKHQPVALNPVELNTWNYEILEILNNSHESNRKNPDTFGDPRLTAKFETILPPHLRKSLPQYEIPTNVSGDETWQRIFHPELIASCNQPPIPPDIAYKLLYCRFPNAKPTL